jgi:MFS family permease
MPGTAPTGGDQVTDDHSRERHDPYAALRNPYVRAFIAGRISATLAAQIIAVGVGWELWQRTRDPWALGLVGLFEVAPVLFLMIPAGNWADRFPRRNLAMLAYVIQATAAAGLTFVSYHAMPVEYVYALLVLTGAARAIAAPSAGTILPQLLDPRLFANSQSWMISSFQFSSIFGGVLAGYLITVFGGEATWTFLFAAAGNLLFVLALLTLPSIPPPPAAGKRSLADVFAGFSFIKRNPVFLAAITLDLFGVLLGGAVALLPVYATDILGVGSEGLGWLRAAPGVGALLTALITTRLPPFERPGVVLLGVVAGFGLATIGFGFSTSFWVAMFFLFLTGATDSVSMVIRGTLQQMITPDHLRGRVASVNSMFINFSNELGMFQSGAAAWLLGPVWAVVTGGIGTLIVCATVATAWPQLARIGPLHTLRPAEADMQPPAPEPAAKPAGA